MKLIASDLDGTLLNEEGVVSQENADSIKSALAQGIQFVVATGRSYEAARKPLLAAGITCPIISLNGAITYSENTEELRSVPLEHAISKKILEVARSADMYIEFFTNEGIYSVSRQYFMEVLIDIMKSANPQISEEEVREKAALRFQAEPVHFIDDYDEIFMKENLIIYKVLAFSLEKEKLAEVRTKLQSEKQVEITSSGDINLEFNHPEALKGIALKSFAESKGIEMEEVMALGDNWNDESMLKMAGRGVAMGNAAPGIKALCSYETKTNIENGVAFAIDEVLNQLSLKK
ncbi:Cof-type HAD-IIB family hydrolase [Oceanobacillus saliphilus]|uniref:Cof-type HAD-IIB family hydrolase n=1 Tax=Oceanobacillus saliphilus TaxID=2925834 RepID=UPI00201D41B5|nr:Cof-type HAD-IIB family hydrolase [Oceanobacillus saliphilus]